MKDEVFGKSVGFSYDTDALERILKEELGEDICMNDVTYPRYKTLFVCLSRTYTNMTVHMCAYACNRVLIPAVKKEFINLKLHFFNNCFNDEYSTRKLDVVDASKLFFTVCNTIMA